MDKKKHLCLLCKKAEVETPYSTCKECSLLCEWCGVNKHNGSGWGMCDSCEEKARQRERYLHWSCKKCEKEFSCDEFLKLEIYVDDACDFCKEKAKEHGAVKVMCEHKY